MFGTACSPWGVDMAWILCWPRLSTRVLGVPAQFWAGISSCHSAADCHDLASLHTSPCPGWRVRRCQGASELLMFPYENEAFWIFWVVLAGMQEACSVGIEVVWKPLLQAGSLADLIWNLLPMEENDCCCWEWLLHSASSWDVLCSHLPAAGSSRLWHRGVCSCGPRALPGRVWVSHGFVLPDTCLQKEPRLLSSTSHFLWFGGSGHPIAVAVAEHPARRLSERGCRLLCQLSLEPKWERKNSNKTR